MPKPKHEKTDDNHHQLSLKPMLSHFLASNERFEVISLNEKCHDSKNSANKEHMRNICEPNRAKQLIELLSICCEGEGVLLTLGPSRQ